MTLDAVCAFTALVTVLIVAAATARRPTCFA